MRKLLIIIGILIILFGMGVVPTPKPNCLETPTSIPNTTVPNTSVPNTETPVLSTIEVTSTVVVETPAIIDTPTTTTIKTEVSQNTPNPTAKPKKKDAPKDSNNQVLPVTGEPKKTNFGGIVIGLGVIVVVVGLLIKRPV